MPYSLRRTRSRQLPIRKALRSWGITGGIALVILLGTGAIASTDPPTVGAPGPVPAAQVNARFDPASRETLVQGGWADLCITFRLAREWSLTRDNLGARLRAEGSGAELDIRPRSAADDHGDLQAGMAAGNAPAWLQEYQAAIGKPAQAVLHETTHLVGVSRWSAVWIDSNFANPSHSFMVETLIIDGKGGSTLELTLADPGAELPAVELSDLLSSLQVSAGEACRHWPPPQRWTTNPGPGLGARR